MKILNPRHSKISKIVNTGDGLIILEDSWNYNKGISNLYKIDFNFNIIWEAFRTPSSEIFYDLTLEDSSLKAHDGSGHADLNPNTGQLTNWVLTK